MDVRKRAHIFMIASVLVLCGTVMKTERINAENRKDSKIMITDDFHHELKVDKDGVYNTTSDVTFTFRDITVPGKNTVSEDSPSDWIFVAEKNESGMLYPVKNNRFDASVQSDAVYEFYWYDKANHVKETDEAFRGMYRLHYVEKPDLTAKGIIVYDDAVQNDGEVYLKGKKPRVAVSPAKDGFTYMYLKSSEGEKTVEITEQDTSFPLAEGRCRVEIWAEDGKGNEEKVSLQFDDFTVDTESPEHPALSISSETDPENHGGELISKGAIQINPEAKDKTSGIDYYIFTLSNGEVLKGGALRLDPDYRGSVRVCAVDMAGNRSGEVGFPGILVLDHTEPVIEKQRADKEDGKIRLRFNVSDKISGLEKAEISYQKKVIKTVDFCGETAPREIEAEISFQKIRDEKSVVTVVLYDRAGNISQKDIMIKSDIGKLISGKEKEEADNEAPEIDIKGFEDFKVYEGTVTILSYASDDDLDPEKTVLNIERRGMEGEVLQEMSARPGSITVREEGNYKVILHGEDRSGNVSEKSGYFTIDKNGPGLMDFSSLDKKTFTSVSFTDDPRNSIQDYSFVTSSLTLSGKKYDGSKVTKPGRYILKMSAVDEAGHRSEEKAEFIIVKDSEKRDETVVSVNRVETNTKIESIRKKQVEVSRNKASVSSSGIESKDRKERKNTVEKENENVPSNNLTWIILISAMIAIVSGFFVIRGMDSNLLTMDKQNES